MNQVSNEWMEGSHRASVGGHPRQKEKVTPLLYGRLASGLRGPDHDCSRQRPKAEAPHLFFPFFFSSDWQIYVCDIFVSLLAFARCLNPASSASFDLCSTFWVCFVVEKCLIFQFFFFFPCLFIPSGITFPSVT